MNDVRPLTVQLEETAEAALDLARRADKRGMFLTSAHHVGRAAGLREVVEALRVAGSRIAGEG